jgi:hypothetical protein
VGRTTAAARATSQGNSLAPPSLHRQLQQRGASPIAALIHEAAPQMQAIFFWQAQAGVGSQAL